MSTERTLTYRILTVAETAALDATATALDKVAAAGQTMAPDLDAAAAGMTDLDSAAGTAATALDRVDTAARGVDIEQVGTEARTTAAKVDTAFDAMGRSAHDGARKIDTGADNAKRSMRGVASEAGDTAREAAQSFGSTGDIGDALQEISAVAPATLGPLGLAFGIVAGVGVGLFRSKTEALKARVTELTEAMIAGAGQITEATVNAKVQQLATDGELANIRDLVELYNVAGVTYRDVARAKAGDQAAIDRVTDALEVETKRRKANTDELGKSEAAVAALSAQVSGSAEAMALAKAATEDYTAATGTAGDSLDTAKASADGLATALTNPVFTGPIDIPVHVQAPSPARLAELRRSIYQGLGPIIADVQLPGDIFNTRNRRP